MYSAALRLRFPLPRQSTNVYVQGGMGAYIVGPIYHYAAGVEYGLLDRLSLSRQVKRFASTSEIGEGFVTLGVNINATTQGPREAYESR